MKSLITIIKSDYLQRTRSYAFLITLCASLAIAYTFVPEPNANYSTIRIADHVGYYNSAWFGYVTSIMTSIFLSLFGFYLINSGIKKDVTTKVGQIVAATPISNFKYLFAKVLSNFLLLLTIVAAVFSMSIVLFFLYHDGYPFEPFQFIKPYVIVTIPTMFFISVLAVLLEVLFGKYSVLQNIGFFFIFSVLMVFTPKEKSEFSLDVFGSKIVISQLEKTVRKITKSDESIDLSVGYIIGNQTKAKKFNFNGMPFPTSFIISRFALIFLGIALIVLISPMFHRFNVKERFSRLKYKPTRQNTRIAKEIILRNLPIPTMNYSIIPLLKTEFLLLLRTGKKWMWIINLIGMASLAILPIDISHQMVLPILWFLQVGGLSNLTTKETTNNTQYFTFTSYKPLSRLLLSQMFAGVILMCLLASPLLVRLSISNELNAVLAVISGGVFIVLLASFLGILSKSKKLFEVLFFMVTYANINGIHFLDYFGGLNNSPYYLIKLVVMVFILGIVSFFIRKLQLQK